MVQESFVVVVRFEDVQRTEVVHKVQRELAKMWPQNEKQTNWAPASKFATPRFDLSQLVANRYNAH